MFESVRSSKRIVQVILLLIILPFAFWGVESYIRNVGTTDAVAKVGEVKITLPEFQQALREQQDRMRNALGRDFSPALLDTPEARQALIDSLVNQRLLALDAQQDRLVVTDEELRRFVASIPAFQEGGQFSMQRYAAVLRTQGLSEAGFEYRLRQDLALRQVSAPVNDGAFVSKAVADRWGALQRETRELAEVLVLPEQFAAQVKLSPDAASAYYEANRKLFEVPEQIRAEYVLLNPDALMEQVAVPDEEVKNWYDAHKDQYRQPEERRASHILIQVPKEATDEQRKTARARAEELLGQLKQNPGDFEKLAKQHSQDPGSAAKGGDLGFFARGMMVKPFEDAAFKLKEGQISDVVGSDFGYHIIKVTGAKAEHGRSLDDVREEIRTDLKRQAAGRKFAEVADGFNNTAYEQSDSLQPAAEKYKLQIAQTGWFSKANSQAAGQLSNERLLAALFSDDAVKNRRNTEAVEVAPNTLIAARVLEHRPAEIRPADAVRADIETKLKNDEAAKLAQKDGEDKLARLVKGESLDLTWSAPKPVTRAGVPGMSPEGVRAAFRLPADKLPGYAGGRLPKGGFAIYKLVTVKAGQAEGSDPKAAGVATQLSRLYGEEDFNEYLASLRARYPVEINKSLLEAKQ
jgi:peptidyl-prolyl cis-trans isomerase D